MGISFSITTVIECRVSGLRMRQLLVTDSVTATSIYLRKAQNKTVVACTITMSAAGIVCSLVCLVAVRIRRFVAAGLFINICPSRILAPPNQTHSRRLDH